MAKSHICCGGAALCRPRSFTALNNSADCIQCNKVLDNLLFVLMKAIRSGKQTDRQDAAELLDRLGFKETHPDHGEG